MAENYKHLYEQTKKMLAMYQDELIPGFRKKIEELEKRKPAPKLMPMGALTYAIACSHCRNRGSNKCDKCKREVESGFELATDNNVGGKWISVKDGFPRKEEYTAKAEDGTEYYVRLLIAYKTDIVEYEIGYYDGYKWMTEMPIRLIKDVVAWMPFPNMPQPPKGE
jgi:hypothetical protein